MTERHVVTINYHIAKGSLDHGIVVAQREGQKGWTVVV